MCMCKEMFALYYGEKIIVQTYEGNIDFNPNGYRDVVGAERFSYDDYIDVQIRSFHKTRGWFATCYHSIPLSFKVTIERKDKDNICFERIFVEGMYPDGLCFDGKEEHVWMSINGFEEYKIGYFPFRTKYKNQFVEPLSEQKTEVLPDNVVLEQLIQ